MLDIRQIRENAEAVNQALARRKPDLSTGAIEQLDAQRRVLLQEEEELRGKRNGITANIAAMKKAGEDTTAIQAETRTLADRIKEIEQRKEELATEQDRLLMELPNTPLPEVPNGPDESANVLIKTWGDEWKCRAPGPVLHHYEIGPELGILDFDRGV